MVGGLATTKLGEESLKRFAKEAFAKENLPYIMGTISLLAMILATAVSSATAAGAGTATFATTGSSMSFSSFGWSEYEPGHNMGTSWPDGTYYHHGYMTMNHYFWLEVTPAGSNLNLLTPVGPSSPRYIWGWYNQRPAVADLHPDKTGPGMAGSSGLLGSSVAWTAGATDPAQSSDPHQTFRNWR